MSGIGGPISAGIGQAIKGLNTAASSMGGHGIGNAISGATNGIMKGAQNALGKVGAGAGQAGAGDAHLLARIAALEAQVAALTAIIRPNGTGVTIAAPGRVQIVASGIDLVAPIVQATGIVKASTVMCDTVIASTYTPGAGNIW